MEFKPKTTKYELGFCEMCGDHCQTLHYESAGFLCDSCTRVIDEGGQEPGHQGIWESCATDEKPVAIVFTSNSKTVVVTFVSPGAFYEWKAEHSDAICEIEAQALTTPGAASAMCWFNRAASSAAIVCNADDEVIASYELGVIDNRPVLLRPYCLGR